MTWLLSKILDFIIQVSTEFLIIISSDHNQTIVILKFWGWRILTKTLILSSDYIIEPLFMLLFWILANKICSVCFNEILWKLYYFSLENFLLAVSNLMITCCFDRYSSHQSFPNLVFQLSILPYSLVCKPYLGLDFLITIFDEELLMEWKPRYSSNSRTFFIFY